MTTEKQRVAARKNIKKAQAKWKGMSSSQHSRSQPEGSSRQRPGSTGEGRYYHVQVRSKSDFVSFRTQDVGKRGHVQRVAGKRASGSWATVKWLIGKEDAHLQGERLVGDTKDAKEVIKQLGSAPVHTRGDQFKAKPRPDVPEKAKPTAAQRHARSTNIKKAQAARRKRS
jgi:hypothetical protein